MQFPASSGCIFQQLKSQNKLNCLMKDKPSVENKACVEVLGSMAEPCNLISLERSSLQQQGVWYAQFKALGMCLSSVPLIRICFSLLCFC